jgi:molybdopterin molybdotransferase
MLSFEDARRRLLELARSMGDERVSVDRASGRVLRERVTSAGDHPPYDQSTMDGYAVRAADCVQSTLIRLPLADGESRAGGPLPPALPAKHAMRIFTGAPMPSGADAVVIQEEVTADGREISFPTAPAIGRFVRPRGQDLRARDVALEPGARLGPAQCALAASLDRAWVRVAARPAVTILATGDELRDPGSGGGDPTAIPDSNGVAIAALARFAGANARIAPAVGDDQNATRAAIRSALCSSDVLVTVGGASVGDHDHVRPAMEAEGVTLDFWKVAIKPGKPLVVGRSGNTIVLGLPGNPASAMITFALFGVPLLRAMQSDRVVLPRSERAHLAASLKREPGRLELYRALVEHDGARSVVRLLGNQASGAIVSMARANALGVVPAETTSLAEGDVIDVLPFAELGL